MAQINQQSFNSPPVAADVAATKMEAVAVAPAGVVTTKQTAVGYSDAPAHVVGPEKAIGEARVDTGFLQALQPNMQQISSTMDKLNEVNAERAAAEAAAQAILQQAGSMMAEAILRQKEVEKARAASEAVLLAQQAEMAEQIARVKTEKLSEAAKAQATAEIEARFAAKAKAEESASVEAARLAAAEVAEAEAMIKAATAKRAQAIAAQRELLSTAGEARADAAAATQRAATLTAQSEARSREARLADEHLVRTADALSNVGDQLAAASIAPPPMATAEITNVKEESSVADGWYPMRSILAAPAQPGAADIPYVLNLRISHADLSSSVSLPKSLLVRVKVGGAEAVADRLVDTRVDSQWKINGSIPVANPNDIVEISLLDGDITAPLSERVLGRTQLRIHTLVDGHLSSDNRLVIDGGLGCLFATMQLQRWNGERNTWKPFNTTDRSKYGFGAPSGTGSYYEFANQQDRFSESAPRSAAY